MGTFHSVTKKHLPNYLNEFELRYNTRRLDNESSPFLVETLPRLLIAYAAFFFDVVVSIFSSRINAVRSVGKWR